MLGRVDAQVLRRASQLRSKRAAPRPHGITAHQPTGDEPRASASCGLAGAGLGGEDGAKVQELQLLNSKVSQVGNRKKDEKNGEKRRAMGK